MTTQTFHQTTVRRTTTTHDGLSVWGRTFLLLGVLTIVVGSVLASVPALVAGTLTAVLAAFLLSCRDMGSTQRVD